MEITVEQQLVMGGRLLLALVLGAAIGWEREQAHRPADLRTMSLVSVGAAAFTLVSIFGFPGPESSRIASGIVTGIGFLGAGTIIRNGASVQGLTTAASVWACAAAGMAAGAGMYVFSVIATVMLMVVLRYFPKQKSGDKT